MKKTIDSLTCPKGKRFDFCQSNYTKNGTFWSFMGTDFGSPYVTLYVRIWSRGVLGHNLGQVRGYFRPLRAKSISAAVQELYSKQWIFKISNFGPQYFSSRRYLKSEKWNLGQNLAKFFAAKIFLRYLLGEKTFVNGTCGAHFGLYLGCH